MTVQSQRCLACGGEHTADAPCLDRPLLERDVPVSPVCNCLPTARDDWLSCAHCGLPQAPGKAFCSFCGHRWVTDGAG